ncbi:MAG: molybdopterin-synthase adenylyltransferase MoeB [Acidimicrobiia bacterium]|jgi:molybdopterin/thiamine biosynthesis adenylyltransferase/rhodanese-related sulfurtransferase
MTGYRDLVAAARARIDEVSPDQLWAQIERVVVLDVREADEHSQGAIPGARFLPRGLVERDIESLIPDRTTALVLYCAAGQRSALAAVSLLEMGYDNVSSMSGGFDAWKAAGLPWGDPTGLTTDQRARYARHVMLPEVGEEGQLRLLASRALIVGAGGLGSPAALYLAAAGVGTIGIVDDDIVDASNLQRQVLHNVDRVGMPKVDSALETLTALNPDVKVETHRERLNASNALRIMSGYDVVVDGGDNFPTRYLVNDASLHLDVPVVHGSIFRFEGQISVFKPWVGPCYRCLHREPPPPELAPSCAEAGVLGVLPGVVGSIQAMEAIKLMLEIGTTLQGRLMIYDALEQEFSTFDLNRDPECLACGDRDRLPVLVDYDETCRPPA